MDTTQKGDELEDKVYELFFNEIENDRFWAKGDCCKIYQKKGYFSRDRQKDIVFDIAIEIFIPGEKYFSSLVLIECKNYNNKVPVGDVESFLMKAHQVSGGNVKAIMVSNNAFQEGAFNFADSKGIGLLRFYDKNNFEWVLHRSPSSIVSINFSKNDYTRAYKALHNSHYENRHFDFFGYVDRQYTSSLHTFIGSLVKQGQEKIHIESLNKIETSQTTKNCLVKYRSEQDIEAICNDLQNEIGYDTGEVCLESLCELLNKHYGLTVLECEKLADGILGEISFKSLEIKISKQHDNEARKRFTLAHELGHFVMKHSEYMSSEKCFESSLDIENPNNIGIDDVSRMEWQANQFASHLLLPTNSFINELNVIIARIGLRDKGFGVIYLDNQQCNIDSYYALTSPLMKKFKVSRKAIKIRLKKLGFIKEPGSILFKF